MFFGNKNRGEETGGNWQDWLEDNQSFFNGKSGQGGSEVGDGIINQFVLFHVGSFS